MSFFVCHTVGSRQPDYCKERTAHAATKRELEDAKVDAASWQQQAEQMLADANDWGRKWEETKRELEEVNAKYFAQSQRIEQLVGYKDENVLLRSRVEELEGLPVGNQETAKGGLWIEVFIPIERLGGVDCEGEECPTLGQAMPRKEIV